MTTITMTATGTLAANRLVTPAAAQAGADAVSIGACSVAAVSGDKIPVCTHGVALVESGAAISLGATLKADASGRVIAWATSGAKVGFALQAATAAGQMIEVLLLDNA